MDSYGYNITSTYEDADNVIIASINEEDLELKSYTAFVDFCKKSRPNIYSINPDLHVITPKGRLARPGLLTKSLGGMGIPFKQFGKPEVSIFREIMEYTALPPHRHVMIGDTIHTDIQGASGVDIDSILIYGNYSKNDALMHYSTQLEIEAISPADELESLLLSSKIQPTYYLKHLKI